MTKLSNRKIQGDIAIDVSQSFGPFVSIQNGLYLFDARKHKVPLWLGYNASPLMGVAQHLEVWTGEWTDALGPIKNACIGLGHKISPGWRSPAELVYSYVCLSILEQFSDERQTIADEIEDHVSQLAKEFSDLIQNPYTNPESFEFGFELRDKHCAVVFPEAALQAGILVTAGPKLSHKFQFFLNLAYRQNELALFWSRLEWLLRNFRDEKAADAEADLCQFRKTSNADYEFHELLIQAKAIEKLPEPEIVASFLNKRLSAFSSQKLDFLFLDPSGYRQHREQILAMQNDVYEPVRQSPPEEFDMLFASEKPLSILVFDSDRLVGMTFAGRLGLFKQERGVSDDPFVDDPSVYYSMDLTISADYRGGLGRIMKQAMCLLAVENGVTAIHGRNRDRLARSMWAINLSLGSFELKRLVDDYPDSGPHRDCIYYRCPLEWKRVTNSETSRIIECLRQMTNGILLTDAILDKKNPRD